jgi:uncharacterized protein (DUF2141 family)
MLNFRFAVAGIAGLALAATASTAVFAGAEISNNLSRCNSGDGPAVFVTVTGLKAATGKIRVQSYRATPSTWLNKGAWINRIDARTTATSMSFCVPMPAPGTYGIAVRHDKNGNGKTDFRQDGGGFSNNPKISVFNLGKPAASKAAITVGNDVKRITINMQYM